MIPFGTVKLVHGSARQLLVPIYSRDQAIFTAVCLTFVLLGCLAVEPAATPYVLGGSWLGMWVVEARHAPVRATIDAANLPTLIATLREAGWKPEPDDSRWVPDVARWKRWSFVQINIEATGDIMQVTGPGSNISRLLAVMKTRQSLSAIEFTPAP